MFTLHFKARSQNKHTDTCYIISHNISKGVTIRGNISGFSVSPSKSIYKAVMPWNTPNHSTSIQGKKMYSLMVVTFYLLYFLHEIIYLVWHCMECDTKKWSENCVNLIGLIIIIRRYYKTSIDIFTKKYFFIPCFMLILT